jgi:hypothetical protein
MMAHRFDEGQEMDNQGAPEQVHVSVKSDRYIALRSGLEAAAIGVILLLAIQAILLSSNNYFGTRSIPDYLYFLIGLILSGLAGYRAYARGITSKRLWFLAGFCAVFILIGFYSLEYIFGSPFQLVSNLSAYFRTVKRVGLFNSLVIDVLTMLVVALVLSPPGALVAVLVPWIAKWISEDPRTVPENESRAIEDNPLEQESVICALPPRAEIPGPLQTAHDLIQAGQSKQVVSWLARYIKEDSQSEFAWLLIAYAIDNPARKRDSLEQVLQINPVNQYAVQLLTAMDNTMVSPLVTATSVPVNKAKERDELHEPSTDITSSSGAQLITASLGLLLIVVFPILGALTAPRSFPVVEQEIYIRKSAFVLTLIMGGILLRRGEREIQKYLVTGAINGGLVGFIVNLVYAILYHMIFYPKYGGDTKIQGILRWFGDELLASTVWGVTLGILGASVLFLLARGYQTSLSKLKAIAPRNAWAAVIIAAVTNDVEQKKIYLLGALSQQPNNPLATRMQASLQTQSDMSPEDASIRKPEPAPTRTQLPQLATTPLGRKFVRRILIVLGILLIWSIVEAIQGQTGTGFTTFSYILCCSSFLIGSGFLVWILVQTLRGISGPSSESSTDPNKE